MRINFFGAGGGYSRIDVQNFDSWIYVAPKEGRGAKTMVDTTQTRSPEPDDVLEEPIPFMQQLLDNPFMLLFLGIAMPTVLYIVWGVMEIVGIPVAK